MKKLNAKQLQTLPKDKYHDGNGLYISISKPGRGKWSFRYTINKKSREMGLGSYPDVSYETYPGPPSPVIIYESGFIHLVQSDDLSYLRIPNDKETETFWKKIDEFNVWSWEKEYANNDILDGFGWELTIKRKGKRKRKIHGYNSYPENEKFFNNFLECINEFTGYKF